MMRLLCDGRILDLPEGVDITFEKYNPLFAFDNLSCERSTSFKLPATPVNNAAFGLSYKPEFNGLQMRRKFNAQLQLGTIVKNGSLYVESYQDGCYNAILVCGEMYAIKKAKDAGKMSEIFDADTMTDTAVYDRTPVYSTTDIFCTSEYRIEAEEGAEFYTRDLMAAPNYPSINFAGLFQRCCSKFGIVAAEPAVNNMVGYYLVPDKLVNRYGDDASVGDTVKLYDNLPDLTFADLVHMWSSISGKQPNVVGNVLTFESLNDVSSWPVVDITNDIKKRGVINRGFNEYARNNYVRSEDSRVKCNYTIDNDNLTESNDLFVFGQELGTEKQIVYFDSDRTNKGILLTNGGWAIGVKREDVEWVQLEDQKMLAFLHVIDEEHYMTGQNYLIYKETGNLAKNSFVQHLCDKSTTIEVEVNMSRLTYENITSKTLLLLNGVKYVWTSAQYAKGVAKFNISKI